MSRTAFLALAIVFLLAWFGGLGYRKLIRADEGRYGEISREMVASGDWLTPRLNGLKYFEKPPLQYWATAAAYAAFGVSEWATRLWPALSGILGVLLVFGAGNRIFGPPAGVFAAAVLGGSALYAAAGHFVSLDMGVSLFLALAVFATVLAQRDGTAEPSRKRWMLLAWAVMSLATLSKGLIGIVLPGAALAIYVLWQRDWALLRRLHSGPGIVLFLAITAPWFIAMSAANPQFARFFFVHEHFERFLTTIHGRDQPPWYFVPVLLVGVMPWITSLMLALWRAARAGEPSLFKPKRFLLVWCATVFVFFSVSGSKLALYILPIFPALAVLIGAEMARAPRYLNTVQGLLAAACGLAVLCIVWQQPQHPEWVGSAAQLVEAYLPWLIAAGALALVLGLAASWLASRGREFAAVLALAAAGLGFVQLVLLGHETLSPLYSAYHAVEKARSALKGDTPFFAVNLYDHTLPFYLRRTVTMVSYRDELAVPIGWEPDKFIADLPAFAEAWRKAPAACGAFVPADFEGIRREYGIAAREVARDVRYLIACKP